MLFAVMFEHGPGWDSVRSLREQDLWNEHASFMDELTATGLVVLGGSLGTEAGALLIVRAADAATVAARLNGDPWLASGHLRVSLIEPWIILLGDQAALPS
jgi:hypothetical protein